MVRKASGPAPASFAAGMAQMEIHPGEPARNGTRMLALIEEARTQGISLLAFPEMCLPGYLLGDAWERPAFIRECETWALRIIAATSPAAPSGAGGAGASATGAMRAGDIAVVFGTVIADWNAKGEDGRPRKFNGYIVAHQGRALTHPGLQRPYGIKTLLPNYREFEDPRHFHDTRKLALESGRPLESLLEPFELELGAGPLRLGVILCEDAWEDDYAQKPIDILGRKGCDLILNLSCSPYTQGKNEKRNRVFAGKVAAIKTPLLYVNAVGLQNNGKTLYTFDGRSTAYAADGSIAAEMPAYAERILPLRLGRGNGVVVLIDAESDGSNGRQAPAANDSADGGDRSRGRLSGAQTADPQRRRIAEIHGALRYGAKAFLDSIGHDRVVIGASGGIDSAVAAALYGEILPPQNLMLVNMPSRFNSKTTRGLAHGLASNLGCLYAEVGIEGSMQVTRDQLDGLEVASPDGKHRAAISLAGFVMENVQARDRSARILAALAASFGGVFACNANKAEMTVGYSTLYGDLGGFLAVLGDLWKGDVYALGRYLNEDVFRREVIPEGVFTVVPSAELGEHQAVDEGKGDPLIYPYHDRLFFSWVQRWNRATPEEILEWYAQGSLNAELGLAGPAAPKLADGSPVDAYALFPDAAAFIRDLERWWNLYCGIAVAKRVQAPPILAVSSRAFGFDHRESIGRPFFSTRYLELKKSLLV